jgi:lipid A 3-O-deacylase
MSRSHLSGARGIGVLSLAMLASALGASGAQAGIIDEVKAGVLAHDVGVLGDSVESGADIVGEMLFTSPRFLDAIGAPRPALGVSGNTAGKTDYLYLDLAWTATVWHQAPQSEEGIYVGGALGGAVHDGQLNQFVDHDKALGTRGLFHLAVEAGYRIDPAYSVELYFDHLSNADISTHNPGLNNVGLRVGFKF